MNNDKIYTIYSHSDADGGIAAALFSKFISTKYSFAGYSVNIQPVNHNSNLKFDWFNFEIKWPCAILDFTLHPLFLSQKFFSPIKALEKKHHPKNEIPECYWIDHHPTGSSFPFLSEKNTAEIIPFATTKWDISAVSTPGLLRTHHQELGIPTELIQEYQEFIDYAEIIDGACYANSEAAYNFFSPTIKLQSLFSSSHPVIDKQSLYKKIVKQIIRSSSIEDLFDSDPIFPAIIQYEEEIYNKQLRSYNTTCKLIGNLAVANFSCGKNFYGMGRFIPYIIYSEAQYALHIMPTQKGYSSISCGINPWNKPQKNLKHLGNYFSENFSGGGHAFVAGGKVSENEFYKIEEFIQFLNS